MRKRAVAQFRDDHAGVELALSEVGLEEAVGLLTAGELDLAVVFEHDRGGASEIPSELLATRLVDDPMYRVRNRRPDGGSGPGRGGRGVHAARVSTATSSGAGAPMVSSRNVWTASTNVVSAPVPAAVASTAGIPPGVVAR